MFLSLQDSIDLNCPLKQSQIGGPWTTREGGVLDGKFQRMGGASPGLASCDSASLPSPGGNLALCAVGLPTPCLLFPLPLEALAFGVPSG